MLKIANRVYETHNAIDTTVAGLEHSLTANVIIGQIVRINIIENTPIFKLSSSCAARTAKKLTLSSRQKQLHLSHYLHLHNIVYFHVPTYLSVEIDLL